MGRSDADFTAQVEEHLGRPLAPDWERSYYDRYERAFEEHLVAVPGVVAALDALDALSVPSCVASSGSHAKIGRNLRRVGLWDRFAGRIVSAEDVRHGKPAPDLFLLAAQRMAVAPGQCVVVEDSRFGVRAARAAGMQVLGFSGGLSPAEWLAGPGTTVFDNFARLPSLLTEVATDTGWSVRRQSRARTHHYRV